MQLTQLAHNYLENHLPKGAWAVDATAGNGHDTLKMAQLVGPTGKVFTVDIQSAAIESTRQRLSDASISNTEFHIGDHAEALDAWASLHPQRISAITFNLGYLPGSDKSIQTEAPSTIRALDASLKLLAPKGVLLVTAYRGHEGGTEEANTVAEWMKQHSETNYTLECHEPKAIRIPPILWVLKHSTHFE